MKTISVEDEEKSKILSLEEGRELLKNTAMANLTDDELQHVLEEIKIFCEMCFDHYMNLQAMKKSSSYIRTA